MTTLALLYLFCLLVGLIYSVISVVLGGHHFGGGHELGQEVSAGEVSFSPLSPMVIASFITAFGAGGLISHYALKVSGVPSVLIALLAGLVVGAVAFYVFYSIFAVTQSSSEAQASALLGVIGEVITPISQHGLGEIAYIIRGSRYTAPAKSARGNLIERNQSVKIINVVGSTLVVEESSGMPGSASS